MAKDSRRGIKMLSTNSGESSRRFRFSRRRRRGCLFQGFLFLLFLSQLQLLELLQRRLAQLFRGVGGSVGFGAGWPHSSWVAFPFQGSLLHEELKDFDRNLGSPFLEFPHVRL